IGAELDLRTHLDRRLQAGGAPLVLLDHLHARPLDRIEVVFADGGSVGVGEYFLHRLARDRVGTVSLLENLAWDLPGAEPGKARLLDEALKGAILRGSELVGGD